MLIEKIHSSYNKDRTIIQINIYKLQKYKLHSKMRLIHLARMWTPLTLQTIDNPTSKNHKVTIDNKMLKRC